jgi:hypothetical protein
VLDKHAGRRLFEHDDFPQRHFQSADQSPLLPPLASFKAHAALVLQAYHIQYPQDSRQLMPANKDFVLVLQDRPMSKFEVAHRPLYIPVPQLLMEFLMCGLFVGQVQAFRLVLRSGRKLLQSDSQELIVTTWLLPIATPSNPVPMQLADNQTAAIADALISKRLALNPVLFGNYSVIQILPPGGLAQAHTVVRPIVLSVSSLIHFLGSSGEVFSVLGFCSI